MRSCFLGARSFLLACFVGAALFVGCGCEDQTGINFPKCDLELIEAKTSSKTQQIKLLGGLTNENYLFTFENGHSYVIKRFNFQLGDFMQRKREIYNQTQACNFLLAPNIEFINEKVGIVEYIDCAQELEVNKESISQCAQLIAKLHYSNLQFEGQFHFVKIIENCLELCRKEKVLSTVEEKFISDVLDKYQSLAKAMSAPSMVPCHNDLHRPNILVNKTGMIFIDWEDSSMNDPAWDISYFLVASFVPDELWPHFFEIYTPLMPHEDPQLTKRVKLYRPFVLLKIALSLKALGKIEEPRSKVVDDLIALCMSSAKKIFYNEGYQAFLEKQCN
jgi:thiamine kinase-like enzyme